MSKAKQRVSKPAANTEITPGLPSIDEGFGVDDATSNATAVESRPGNDQLDDDGPIAPPPPEVREVEIAVLLKNPGDGYRSRHLQIQSLSAPEAQMLAELRAALAGNKLANGRLITSNADVIRWLLQAIKEGKASAKE